MNWGLIWEIFLLIARGWIFYMVIAGAVTSFFIWSFTKAIEGGELEEDKLERVRTRRDKMIRYAARKGLWGSNYSLAEQIEVVDVGLNLIDKEDGDHEIILVLVDKYDTRLELGLNPEGLLQMAAVYQKITSPAARMQMDRLRKTFRSNTQC